MCSILDVCMITFKIRKQTKMELTKDLDLDSGILATVDVLSKDSVISSLFPGDRVELQQVDVLLLDHLHSLSKHQRDAVSLPANFR